MLIMKCALGVIQQRGAKVVDPRVVTFGPAEADYLTRHVSKVREAREASARSVFSGAATGTTAQLKTLLSTGSSKTYEGSSKTLQDALAQAMKTSSNARDCVFAIVRAADASGAAPHVTLLKLDAVVEAARMRLIAGGGVTFKVLKDLLPEPGKLQKALSWPDPRSVSDVIMLDTNVIGAQYFENAFQVKVSPRSTEAEAELASALHQCVPLRSLPAAVAAAAQLDGPLDVVLTKLATTYPQLQQTAQAVAADPRPSGIIRSNKVAARPVVWRTEGVEVSVDPTLVRSVTVTPTRDGWSIAVATRTEPVREG